MPDHINKIFPGKRLKIARIALGLTQKALANELGLKWYQIKDIELGKTKLAADVVFKLQQKFGISTSWLLTGEGEMFVKKDAVSQTFIGKENQNVIQAINSQVLHNFEKGNNNIDDEEISIILNKLKNIIKNEPKIKQIILNLIDGNYTPKILEEFLEKLNKIREFQS